MPEENQVIGITDEQLPKFEVRSEVPQGQPYNITTLPRYLEIEVFSPTTDVSTGDGKKYIHIPPGLDGMKMNYAHARVITAGTTGTTDIQIHNLTDGVDILLSKLTIDSTETGSNDAATPYEVNEANWIVSENDLLRIDIDAVSTTPPKGLIVTLGFRNP